MLCKICSSREIENYCWLCIHKHIPTESVFSHDSTTSFHYWTVQCWSQLQEGQIWFFSWWGKNLQLQTLPNMKDRTLGPVQGENISKTHSKAPLCKTSAFWASFSSFFCLTLIWSQKPNFNQLITSQTTTNMLKCKYYIQTRSWKNWLSREQDLQKQLELSSIQINFLNPLKPILFLILQALHSLCTHFLPHTGPTQLSTSAGLSAEDTGNLTGALKSTGTTQLLHFTMEAQQDIPFLHLKTSKCIWNIKKLRHTLVPSLVILIRGKRPLNIKEQS